MSPTPLSLALAFALLPTPSVAHADAATPARDAAHDVAHDDAHDSADVEAHAGAHDAGHEDRTVKTLGTVTVTGVRPTSLPTQIPTTIESALAADIDTKINATDAEDALKYFPSLLVRKRFIGDYDHAVLATRASGTGNSARSLVYADGILLSNLLGNGATFTPRWGLVTPAEIARVDVLYGPFSAAYPGNSVGAVVDYVTRMPTHFEAHAQYGAYRQDVDLYRIHDSDTSRSAGASIGDRWGRLSAWLSLDRLDSDSQPVVFGTVLASAGTSGSGTAVTGAVAGRNPRNQPWYLLGATNQVDTVQDHAKLKLAWDFGDDLRLSWLYGLWRNDVVRDSETWLRDAAGNPVYSGNVLIDGRRYSVPASAIGLQRATLDHRMQGLSLKRSSGGAFDYSVSLSRYDYVRDRTRSPLVARPVADTGGAGRIADSDGTGWTTASAALTWRPDDAHVVEFGLQHDRYTLDTRVFDTADWLHGAPGARFSAFGGFASLTGAYAQDTWRWSERWTGTFGLRAERWRARDGRLANATTTVRFPARTDSTFSPKAALAYAFSPDWSVQASIGRAVRFPTVSELFQGSIATNAVVNNDPDLKPERSTTAELSLLRAFDRGDLRATLFHERTRDALYSQTNVIVTPNVTSIQNVGAIRTTGIELAGKMRGIGLPGPGSTTLDLDGSLTFTDSIVRENDAFPASVGQWQPRVPRWRANLLATWTTNARWSATGGARYSGRQFNTLDNSDPHSNAYTGTSPFFVVDARVRYAPTERWRFAVGVDNLNNRTYWNFHPYPRRTWVFEVRCDLE